MSVDVATPPDLAAPRAGFVHDTAAVFVREFQLVLRDPFSLIFSLVQPLVFLGLFGPLLGGSVTEEALGGQSPLQWFLPGVIVMICLFGTGAAGSRLSRPATRSVFDRPASRSASSSAGEWPAPVRRRRISAAARRAAPTSASSALLANGTVTGSNRCCTQIVPRYRVPARMPMASRGRMPSSGCSSMATTCSPARSRASTPHSRSLAM